MTCCKAGRIRKCTDSRAPQKRSKGRVVAMPHRRLFSVLLLLLSGGACAWSNHAVLTWPALAGVPEVASAAPVSVEPLARFLEAEGGALVRLLADEEAWARANVPTYPPRPDALAWRADPGARSDEERIALFVAATRINPQSRLALFQQLKPGDTVGSREVLAEAAVTPLNSTESTKFAMFVALREGQTVAPIDVIATASDEPDYGLDVGIWADNRTPHGAAYGMGRQPFGNPAIEFSSQTPMHLGFYHEATIVYKAAPFLQRCYPEARIHLWRSLAAHAFRTGHPYWGWRFAGWALHYAQDLTQPYHARVLPGVGVARLLATNTLDLIGLHSPKADAIARVTNRHLALENFEVRLLRAAIEQGRSDDPALRALRGGADRDRRASYSDASVRGEISAEAAAAADAIDSAIAAYVPRKYTDDPSYTFGVSETGIDLYREVAGVSPAAQRALMDQIAPLLGNAGRHTRAFVLSLVGPAARP